MDGRCGALPHGRRARQRGLCHQAAPGAGADRPRSGCGAALRLGRADSVYGGDGSLRLWLEERQQPDVLAVTGQYRIFDGGRREWAVTIAKRRPARAWKKSSGGAGSKGERLSGWTYWQIRTIDKERCRWLLARRSPQDHGDVSCFVVSGPKTTALEEMVRVVGARRAIEECFETAKGELGLDQHEVRRWAGWQRHPVLVWWLQALLNVLHVKAQPPDPPSAPPRVPRKKRAKSHALPSSPQPSLP